MASLVAQMAKNLPAMQEIWVWSLGEEDPLEKGMATHYSILALRSPWTDHVVAKSHKELMSTIQSANNNRFICNCKDSFN